MITVKEFEIWLEEDVELSEKISKINEYDNKTEPAFKGKYAYIFENNLNLENKKEFINSIKLIIYLYEKDYKNLVYFMKTYLNFTSEYSRNDEIYTYDYREKVKNRFCNYVSLNNNLIVISSWKKELSYDEFNEIKRMM